MLAVQKDRRGATPISSWLADRLRGDKRRADRDGLVIEGCAVLISQISTPNRLAARRRRKKPDTNTTSTELGQAILAAMQEEMRRMVLGEMRTAGQLATLAGRGTNNIRRDLDLWAADGRILSIQLEDVDYFTLFALNPPAGYRPYPAVAHVIRVLSRILNRENSWGLHPGLLA